MNEITIEENFEKVEVTNLLKTMFYPGDIYWEKLGGKKLKLFNAGRPVNSEDLDKYNKDSIHLLIDKVANTESQDVYRELLHKLQSATSEVEKLEIRQDIIDWVKPKYWDGTESSSLLDLVVIGFDLFNEFTTEVINEFVESSSILFVRSALNASFSTIYALSLGYTNFHFLKELYHLVFLFDFGLTKDLSYNMLKASELEMEGAGHGVAFLFLGENPGPELDQFIGHTKSSIELIKEQKPFVFSDPAILKLIEIHHEKINGKGFPLSYKMEELSDLESIIIAVSHMFEYDGYDFNKADGTAFLKNYISEPSSTSKNKSKVVSNRLRKFFLDAFKNIESAA